MVEKPFSLSYSTINFKYGLGPIRSPKRRRRWRRFAAAAKHQKFQYLWGTPDKITVSSFEGITNDIETV